MEKRKQNALFFDRGSMENIFEMRPVSADLAKISVWRGPGRRTERTKDWDMWGERRRGSRSRKKTSVAGIGE